MNDVDRYAAIIQENGTLREQLDVLEGELQNVNEHNQSILTEQAEHYAALRHEVVDLKRDKSDAERIKRINDLAAQYPVIDVKEELDRSLYSAGADVSDAGFEERCELIERYAAAAVVASPMVPVGSMRTVGSAGVEQDLYEARAADRAIDIINSHIKRGERIGYPEAVAKAKEQLS